MKRKRKRGRNKGKRTFRRAVTEESRAENGFHVSRWRGFGEGGFVSLSSRVEKVFQTSYGGVGNGWGPWKPIPSPLCVNTESLAAIKAIPARYLTAFKMARSCESIKTPSFAPVVFHFPPFHIDFRATMKFQRGPLCSLRRPREGEEGEEEGEKNK